jgi:hypothetical protein
MNLSEHFSHQQEHPRQWNHCRAMGAIAEAAMQVAHYDPEAEALLSPENAQILGEYVLSLSEDGQRAAWFSVGTSRSGCNATITYISWRGKKMLEHFAGDRCNAPASHTEWQWIRGPFR